MQNLMIFPAKNNSDTKLVKYPDHYDSREVYRYVTGLIAEVEEDNESCSWEDVAAHLEAHGFEVIDFVLGPEICEK